jgi:hypothetical protein
LPKEASHLQHFAGGSKSDANREERIADTYAEIATVRYKAASKKAELDAYRAACVAGVR